MLGYFSANGRTTFLSRESLSTSQALSIASGFLAVASAEASWKVAGGGGSRSTDCEIGLAGSLQGGKRDPRGHDMLTVGIEIQERPVGRHRILLLDGRPGEFFRAFKLSDPVAHLGDMGAGGELLGEPAQRRDLAAWRARTSRRPVRLRPRRRRRLRWRRP